MNMDVRAGTKGFTKQGCLFQRYLHSLDTWSPAFLLGKNGGHKREVGSMDGYTQSSCFFENQGLLGNTDISRFINWGHRDPQISPMWNRLQLSILWPLLYFSMC